MEKDPTTISEIVKTRYSTVAKTMKTGQDCCTDSCCQSTEVMTEKINLDTTGSTEEDCCADSCCQDTGESLGCDLRLLEIAAPQKDEVVVDLGSGPGHDSRKVAQLVGSGGRVIGIDFSQDMIDLAKTKSQEYDNIEYMQSKIEEIPLSDESVDLIISNCVFNLVPDKSAVFAEAFRILRPQGRLVISDMITQDTGIEFSEDEYCACIGGATSIEAYVEMMEAAGFSDIETITEYEDTYLKSVHPIKYQSVLFVGHK